MFELEVYIEQQRLWSAKTFGPGRRTVGIVKHIEKELREIEQAPRDVSEWCDVIILALDGAWRAGFEPAEICEALVAKQAKNFARRWPAAGPEDTPTEHVRQEAQR